jgi:serine/threonine-protein kinase
VTIPALEDLPPPVAAVQETAEPRATSVPTAPETPSHTHDESAGAGNAQRVGALLLGGAGLLGVAVGTFFSFDAKSTYDASNKGGLCLANNDCLPAGMADRERANKQAVVATVAMGVGAAAIVSGAVLYFFAPSRSGNTSVAIAPDVHGAAIRVAVAW